MFMLIVKAGVLAFATATGAACAVATLGIRADLLDKTQKIHKAAIRGDVVEVGDCLARNIPPDVRSGMQRTGLIYAAYLGRTAVVELLLSAGSDCQLVDYRAASALHCAAAGGHKDACRLLLDAGARVNGRTRSGLTPLHLAAQAGMAETVQLLLAFNADLNAVGGGKQATPLMLAVSPDRWELFIGELVFQGSWAEPGEQPNQRRVLQLLAQAGANLQARNSDGLTVADLAARSKNQTLINTVQALRNVTPVRWRPPPPAPARRINVQAGASCRRPAAPAAPAAQPQRAAAPARAACAAAPAASAAAAVQCVVCMDAPRAMACIPCGHMSYCLECVRALNDRDRRQCSICRARTTSIVRIYQT